MCYLHGFPGEFVVLDVAVPLGYDFGNSAFGHRVAVGYADAGVVALVTYTTDIDGLDIIPSHIDLVGAEIEMLNFDGRENIMKKILAILLALALLVLCCAGCGSKENKKLLVATNAEFAPWEYKQGTEFFGIDMEIAQLIATELGLELVIEDMEFDAVVGAVGKQNVDIAMSGITITTERQQVINFSTPYYTESIVVVCKEGDTSLGSCGTVVDILNVLCAAN